jgi:hypothetical protein
MKNVLFSVERQPLVIKHGDTEAQRHSLLSDRHQAVSLCLRVSVLKILLPTTCVAAQVPPRKMKNPTRADRGARRGVLAWPESCEEAYRESYPEEQK